MKFNTLASSIALATLTAVATANAGTVTSDGQDIVIKTKGGLKVSTADNKYSIKIGGRIQYDYNRAELNGEADEDQFNRRRARLYAAGNINDWSYKAQFNIGGSSGGTAEDLYIRYNGFGKKAVITAGKQRIPFGLEDLTSSNDITMLERTAITERYAIAREEGVVLSGKEGDFTYSLAAFEDSTAPNNGSGSGDDFGIAARVTFAPVQTENSVVHVGAAYKDIGNDTSAFGLEFAATLDSLHGQMEFFDADENGNDADGYYLQVGYILTGEQRPYKDGKFKRVKPQGDNGAFEVVIRYEDGEGNFADVELGNTNASAWGIGLNWYANNNIRVGVNYTDADDDNSNNDGDEFRARVQLTF